LNFHYLELPPAGRRRAAGIRLHFLLCRKQMFRRHPAGGDQAATGSLDLTFEALLRR